MAYSEPPVRNSVREIVTSLYSIGRAPSLLSMVSETCARPSGGRPEVPAKMTSSILPPRRVLAPCSPMTQASASTTLDLPEPLGPTTAVTPGSNSKVVAEANDLNPRTVRLFRCKAFGSPGRRTGPLSDESMIRTDTGVPGRPRILTIYCASAAIPRRTSAEPPQMAEAAYAGIDLHGA